MRRDAKKVFIAVLLLGLAVSALGQQRTSRSQRFKAAAGGTLQLEVKSGRVLIHVGSADVGIEARRLVDADRNLVMSQQGNTIRVEYGTRLRWNDLPSSEFEISIPQQFNLDLRTSGADVTIDGDIDGYVLGKTSGGDIRAHSVSGDLDLGTSGGDVTVGILGAQASIHTSGGDIKAKSAAGGVDFHTSGGDIEIGDVGGAFDAKTSGGDIEAGNVASDVEAATSGGDIQLAIVSGKANMRTSGGDITIQAAYGPVDARTSGGDIELGEVTGYLVAKTAGGDVSAVLRPEGKDSAIETSGGDIQLGLASAARATIEARVIMRPDRYRRYRSGKYGVRSDFDAASYETDPDTGSIYAVYQINGGGPMIRLETKEGLISIRRVD